MSVHYKFKNTKDYDAIKFDGVYISASDLKSQIAQQKKLGNSELQLSNEETKEIYSDDQMIPKNTNVIVLRLPHANANKKARMQHGTNQIHNNSHYNNAYHHKNPSASRAGGTSGASATSMSSSISSMTNSGIGGGREALEIVTNKNMTEEERIKYIQSQATRDFDPSRYARGGGRGGHSRGGARGAGTFRHHTPRPGYTCVKCGIPGHFVQDCKNTIHKVKRSSGIPRDFLMKVDSNEKGALMTPSGEYAVPIIDREAYSKPKVERAPFFEDGIPEEEERDEKSALQLVEHPSNDMATTSTNGSQIAEDNQLVAKPGKLGFAVPNWKNISKSEQPDADRYSQYHMVQIRSHCEALVASREKNLLNAPMYTISTNVLCRHTKNDKDIYVPIEIGIHCYAMAAGHLGKTYHCLINAGPIPVGLINKARDHMEATHKISIPSKGDYPTKARTDYLNIYKEMLKYVHKGERTVLVPDERDMDQVKGCLEWIYEKAAFVDPQVPRISTWTIMPMVEYVAAAYNFVYQRILRNPKPIFTVHYIIKLHQEDSTWDYEDRYICEYHRDYDNQTKWCAKNCAARAFLAVERILDDLTKCYKAAMNSASKTGSLTRYETTNPSQSANNHKHQETAAR